MTHVDKSLYITYIRTHIYIYICYSIKPIVYVYVYMYTYVQSDIYTNVCIHVMCVYVEAGGSPRATFDTLPGPFLGPHAPRRPFGHPAEHLRTVGTEEYHDEGLNPM